MRTQGAVRWAVDETGEDVRLPVESGLKLQAAERLAAHRARRGIVAEPTLFSEAELAPRRPETRAERIAAAVAERYASSPSYRAFLEAEAQRAVEEARARAEAAYRAVAEAAEAERVVVAQQQMLADLQCLIAVEPEAIGEVVIESVSEPSRPLAVTVRLYEERRTLNVGPRRANAVPQETPEEEERMALEEEIAFRQAPMFEDVQRAVPLPANLIEFPRQLVAARRVRPRFAEGPLREEAAAGAEGQLRIFEVEPELISNQPEMEAVLPEWSSIRLGACAVTEPVATAEYPVSYAPRPLAAPLGLRLMAALVDGCVLLGTFLAVVVALAACAGPVAVDQTMLIAAGATMGVLALGYHAFFFTFGSATPGMLYARIGLCSLTDDNPTRAAMRLRLVAVVLALAPLGLGFLWALVDEDGLGWHDRMSRMYQRSY